MRHRSRVAPPVVLGSTEGTTTLPRGASATPTTTPEGDPSREHRNIVCGVPLGLYDL
jgi:hypothetical protein